MQQTSSVISTYSADTFGVCSMLYELGGMVVMHDASGCNSTYSTHDEPRWNKIRSNIFVSAVTQMEALMGDEEKLITDVIAAAKDLNPKFIAICGTPIPTMVGFDFEAVARVIEARTGIPSIGVASTGMKSYVDGASKALLKIVKRIVSARNVSREALEKAASKESDAAKRISVLGVTPLDFSINGQDKSITSFLESKGYDVLGNFCMDVELSDIGNITSSDETLVVSAIGYETAKFLKEEQDIPYEIGLPINGVLHKKITSDITSDKRIAILGEGVTSYSIALSIMNTLGVKAVPVVTVDIAKDLFDRMNAVTTTKHLIYEDDIKEELKNYDIVIADPLFRPIVGKDKAFINLPTECFSGRIYRKDIPDIVATSFIEDAVKKYL